MIIALSGGIGGAKLALGLAHVLPPEELLIIANTAGKRDDHGKRSSCAGRSNSAAGFAAPDQDSPRTSTAG